MTSEPPNTVELAARWDKLADEAFDNRDGIVTGHPMRRALEARGNALRKCAAELREAAAALAALHAERAAMREALTTVRDELADAARDLVHDAASWREASDSTSGHAASKLMSDALENETRATQLEAWADKLDALSASVPPPATDTPREKAAFKAGYHCRWDRLAGEYGFDPAMAPGDPDGAYAAWLQSRQ